SEQQPRQPGTVAHEQQSQTRGAWPTCGRCGLPMVPEGLGTALKPSHEPIILARKPLCGTVAANVLAHGTGALNIDASRIEGGGPKGEGGRLKAATGSTSAFNGGQHNAVDDTAGRWPSNVILD